MSLIDRLAQESIKQNKLISQLSEISYRAINGKRQNARNFNEGTLNVGTMNFNTAPDKITKDMFMDYQKAEQQKHYDDGTNKFQYDPTGLFDPMTGNATIPLVQPISIPLPGTTAEATEQDVNDETTQWRQLHKDLVNLKEDIIKKEEEIEKKYEEKSEAKNKININNEEIKRIENRIIPIDAELARITAELVRQRAMAAGTTGRMARINAEFKKERDKNAIKLPLETEAKWHVRVIR